MRFILAILMLTVCFLSLPSFAALSNANNPHLVCVPMGSLSADGVVLGAASAKGMEAQSAYLVSAAGIAASNSDYAILNIKKGSTILASLDTRAAGQGAVTANVAKAMSMVSAEKSISAGATVSVEYDETDTGTVVALSGAVVCLQYAVK